MNNELLIIELAKEDADEFVLWQKYKLQFQKLMDKKVFEQNEDIDVVLKIKNRNIKKIKVIHSWDF